MEQTPRLRICFCFAIFLGSQLKAESIFTYYELKNLSSCLKQIKKDALEDLEITCPLPEFVAKVRAENYTEPGVRYMVARLLVKALNNRHQTELIKNTETAQESSAAVATTAELFPNIPSSRGQFMQYFFPEGESEKIHALPPSKEATFVSSTTHLVEEILFWLTPLRTPSEGKAHADFLQGETSHLLFWTYGLSLRFDALAGLISENEKDLLSNRDFEQLYLSQVSGWIKMFGALPLRAWYAAKIQTKLGPPGGALSDTSWNYWTESLRLLERPVVPENKETVLAQLRWLWVISPEAKRNAEIERLGSELGFGDEMNSWSVKTLNLREYMWRVQALSSSLNTHSAEQMMDKLLKENSKLLTSKDEIWDALQLHIRLLKIQDDRTRIAPLIGKYDQKFGFFTAPTEKSELLKHFERMYQLAVQFWTLEDNKQTLALLDRIDAYRSKEARGVQTKVAYVRARMNEGKDVEVLKKTFKLDLRDDQKLEIGWRTFFKLLEGSTKQVGESLSFIESNTGLFKRLGESSLKIDFWKAFAQNKRKDKDGLKLLNKNFDEDPYNFYGLLSAMLIRDISGKFPAGWEIPAKAASSQFKEKKYLTAEGYPAEDQAVSVARALALAKARDFDRALAVIRAAVGSGAWRSPANVEDQRARLRDFARLSVALGDKRGAMNLMTGLLNKKGEDLNSEDWEFIFPRVFEKEIRKRTEGDEFDPWIISSIIRQESGFDPRARSPVDALGLMQLLPVTAQKEARANNRKNFKPEDLFNPDVSIDLGASNIKRLLDLFQTSYICSFAAYNAGSPPVKNWLRTNGSQPLVFTERIPYKETRDYVKKLIRNLVMYRRLYEKESAPLQKFLTMPSAKVSDRVSEYETPDRVAQK